MSDKKDDNHSIGSVLRDRGKTPKADIGDLWLSQEISNNHKSKVTKSALLPYIISAKNSLKKAGKKVKNPKVLPASMSSFARNKKYILIAIVLLAAFIFRSNFGTKEGSTNEVDQLGVSTEQQKQGSAPEIPTVSSTDFDLLWPTGTDQEATEVVKVSPPSNDAVYAFLSVFNGAELRVSQQKIPESFKDNLEEEIRQVAESFLATEIIQVDDTKVYHGFSDANGGVQSLIFEKNGVLVLIASPVKFLDAEWVGYIASFNQ